MTGTAGRNKPLKRIRGDLELLRKQLIWLYQEAGNARETVPGEY
jgi:hypothetical protein